MEIILVFQRPGFLITAWKAVPLCPWTDDGVVVLLQETNGPQHPLFDGVGHSGRSRRFGVLHFHSWRKQMNGVISLCFLKERYCNLAFKLESVPTSLESRPELSTLPWTNTSKISFWNSRRGDLWRGFLSPYDASLLVRFYCTSHFMLSCGSLPFAGYQEFSRAGIKIGSASTSADWLLDSIFWRRFIVILKLFSC